MKVRGLIVAAALLLCLAGCAEESESGPGGVADGTPTDLGGDAPEDAADAPGDLGEAEVIVADTADAQADAEEDVGPPPEVWQLTRPQAGEPLSDDEVAAFTKTITGFWKDVGYWRWVSGHVHGMDPDNPDAWLDYALWWQDTQAIKQGDTILYSHTGGADNLMIRTSKAFNNAASGYLAFGDPTLKWITVQLAKGIVAVAKGLEWGDDDPAPYVMARAIFTHDHDYLTPDGRKARVEYGPVKQQESYGWNAATIPYEQNPYWGAIWVRNQRSKDDVPHIYRTAPVLMRLISEAPDEDVRVAAEEALEYVQGFARDIVDSGYLIRTKFQDGVAVVPTKEGGSIKDLASLVMYEILDPNAECTGKLGSTLLAYGEARGNACSDGYGGLYEEIATEGHYFNYAIVRYFHVAAVYNALALGLDVGTEALMQGLFARFDRMMHDDDMPHADDRSWDADAAATLLAGAAAGVPLSDEEARLISELYTRSAEHFGAWTFWDPWDESIPDGPFNYKPNRDTGADTPQVVRDTELPYLLEYCASPWKNPNGARLVDCDVVLDPTRWGL